MSEEKPTEMRVRILKEFAALKLPVTLPAQKDASAAELSVIRSIFRDGFIEGSILPDHKGSGIAAIFVTGISAEAHDLIDNSARIAPALNPSTLEMHFWDVFVCHASEDKAGVARPLANHLAALGVRAWLDESELQVGDSLHCKIDSGLAQSRFGVVILSPHFFAKDWTKAELGGLIAREVDGRKVVLPIWHNMSSKALRQHSPILAGRVAISTREGLLVIAKKIQSVVESASSRYRPGAPIFAGRLTKTALLRLPRGSFLVTNCVNQDRTPILSDSLPPAEDREALWQRLRDRGLASTKIYAFSNAGEYRKHVAARDIWTVEM